MWWISVALAAPCDPAVLDTQLEQAEAAFLRGDTAATRRASRQAVELAVCGSAEQVARAYRTSALVAQLEGKQAARRRALHASLSAHPLLALDGPLADDDDLARAWQLAQEDTLGWSAGRMQLVNGVRTPLVPNAPHVGGRNGRALRVSAIGLGAVAGGLYASAWVSRSRYDKTVGQPAAERLSSYRTTNGLTLGALTAAVASGTLLSVSFAL